jgi:phospholipid transport system substrate-binding protein
MRTHQALMSVLATAFFLSMSSCALAQASSAQDLVSSVSDDALQVIRKNKAQIKGARVDQIIQQVANKVTPHFNLTHMARLALGKHWRSATPDQQEQIADEFRALLLRTYSKALSDYDNQTIVVLPAREAGTDTETRVRTEVRKPGAQPIHIDYTLEKIAGSWKVFDITVEGVSLITNYRGDFDSEVSRNGIEGLLNSLRQKNKAAPSSSAKAGL